MNNCISNCNENVVLLSRIAEAQNCFNVVFGAVTERKFSYLWVKRGEEKATYPFEVSTPENRRKMAQKAIELSEEGFDVYYGINLVDTPLDGAQRARNDTVSVQTATITDIDIEGGKHASDAKKKYPPTFEAAGACLPFPVSMLVESGYGLHGYAIYSEPIAITSSNRVQAKERNKKFIDCIRARADSYSKAVDGVSDLARVLRVPGTYNYKCGRSNAPLCRIVEDSGLRFEVDALDEKLNALTETTHAAPKTKSCAEFKGRKEDSPDLKEFRIRRMLEFIPPASLTYDEWLQVGIALFNEGLDCSLWEQWSRADSRFKEGECQAKWQGFHYDPCGITIGTLYQFAAQNGYDEKETRREWHALQPEPLPKRKNDSTPDFLEEKLKEVDLAVASFDEKIKAAVTTLENLIPNDAPTVLNHVDEAALAFAFDKTAFAKWELVVKEFSAKNPDKTFSIQNWKNAVKAKADEFEKHRAHLLKEQTILVAQKKSRAFLADSDSPPNFEIPAGYEISDDGIFKVDEKKPFLVCHLPVFPAQIVYSVDEGIKKIQLAIKTHSGKMRLLPPQQMSLVFNSRKLVDLADMDLPVTSENAKDLVKYLDASFHLNEKNIPVTHTFERGGWHSIDKQEFFLDPRIPCVIQKDGREISVEVDQKRNEFANHLTTRGTFEDWKKAYSLAKDSKVARLMLAAAVAPPLLKVLNERNFLLYIYAPTRAGKTTALYLAASAFGDEKVIRSFDATKNGFLGAAAAVNDYAFLVDEKQVADNRFKEQFDLVIYAVANGIPRTKLNRDSTLKKTLEWRTTAVMTGETRMIDDNATGGAFTRCMQIQGPKIILPADVCRNIRGICAENFGFALPRVIEQIQSVGKESLRENYKIIFEGRQHIFKQILPEYVRYMTLLAIADNLLSRAVSETKSPFSAGTGAIDNTVCEFLELVPTLDEIDDTPREIEFIRGCIAQSHNQFVRDDKPAGDIRGGIFGLIDDDYIYVIATVFKELCKRGGFDYRKVAADLIAAGIILPADTIERGRKTPLPTVKKWLGTEATRFLNSPSARCYRIKNESRTITVDDIDE